MARSHYFDASALVKLFVPEQGSEYLHAFMKVNTTFYSTSFCFAEALSVLKRKHLLTKDHDCIDRETYLKALKDISIWIGTIIRIDDVPFGKNPIGIFREAEGLINKYDIDMIDALQIITIRKGIIALEGKLLITADKGLEKAAQGEGVTVWNCLHAYEG